jgi:hypothetical protein
MARDAIARQYDVEKNKVTLTCDTDKGSYRPGTITFYAKKGKSIDLDQVRESIAATRLSGGTNMGMEYLEITATGNVAISDRDLILDVSGTGQQFFLEESASAKGALQRLRDAVAKGEKVNTVVGRLPGWSGKFPAALGGLAKTRPDARAVLIVTDFELVKK